MAGHLKRGTGHLKKTSDGHLSIGCATPCTGCADLASSYTATLPNTSSWNWPGADSCTPSVLSWVMVQSYAYLSCEYGDPFVGSDPANRVCIGGANVGTFLFYDYDNLRWIIYLYAYYGTSSISGAVMYTHDGGECDVAGTYVYAGEIEPSGATTYSATIVIS